MQGFDDPRLIARFSFIMFQSFGNRFGMSGSRRKYAAPLCGRKWFVWSYWISSYDVSFLSCVTINRISIRKLSTSSSNFSPVATNILNEKNLSPVHLATELNKVKALQVMGKHRDVIDIQQGGEHGRTALHLAAIYDHEDCARILVS